MQPAGPGETGKLLLQNFIAGVDVYVKLRRVIPLEAGDGEDLFGRAILVVAAPAGAIKNARDPLLIADRLPTGSSMRLLALLNGDLPASIATFSKALVFCIALS